MNQIRSGAILSYVSLGISNVIGITYTPFMLRELGQSEYGIYSLAFSIVSTLALLDGGLGVTIVRYVSKYKQEDERKIPSLLGLFLITYCAIGVLSICVNLLLIESVNFNSVSVDNYEKVRSIIWIIGIYISLGFPFTIFNSIIIAYERFVFLKVLNIAFAILQPMIMIPLLMLGYKSVAMAAVLVLVGVLKWIVNYAYCKKRIKVNFSFVNLDWGILKTLLSFSVFIFLKMLLDRLYWSSGQFLLGIYSGTIMVAIFSLGLQLRGYFDAFARAIDGIFLPRCVALCRDEYNERELSFLFCKVGRLQSLVLGPIFSLYFLYGGVFVKLWAGDGYVDSYHISLILMLASLIPLTQTLGNTILQAKNLLKFQAVLYVFLSIFVVIGSVVMIEPFGIYGCVISLCFALLVGDVIIMNIYYNRVLKLDIIRFWKEIIKIIFMQFLLLAGFYLFFKNIFFDDWFHLILYSLLYCIVYVMVSYFCILNPFEKELFDLLITKIKKICF